MYFKTTPTTGAGPGIQLSASGPTDRPCYIVIVPAGKFFSFIILFGIDLNIIDRSIDIFLYITSFCLK